MRHERLWAKKLYNGTAPTVDEHCRHVLDAATCMFTNLKDEMTKNLKCEASSVVSLLQLLQVSAVLHDVGKANSSFQEMLKSNANDGVRQPVRHEILGAWLLSDPDFWGEWFIGLCPNEEAWPMIWAISGHHAKMGDPARQSPLFNAGSGTRFVDIFLSCPSITELLGEAAAKIGPNRNLPERENVRFDTADDDQFGLEQRINNFAKSSCKAWIYLRGNPVVVQRTALLKAMLISADVAASALTAKGETPPEWIPRILAVRISSADLEPIILQGTKGKAPLPFQIDVGTSDQRATIVIAGCGNGKTTAAYLWAQKHANGRKLWFTYPTTGTASAGYSGYLHDHPDLKAELIHGRAEVDLLAIRGNDKNDENDDWLRLESLRAWGQQAIACTVDTVLGLLQNHRRPLFSFPAIMTGAIVFDEIHSYDCRLFGALLRFLKTFPGIPVLIMSASIPPRRLAALHEALGTQDKDVIRGDFALEKHKRYKLVPRISAESCRLDVIEALRNKKKVLWVCNTVQDAVNIAREAQQWVGIPEERIVIYHSRFRYRNRVQRQKQVLTEFAYHTDELLRGKRKNPEAALVIATQVCEMSLDISADLLITPECPLPSMIQRLGRLNRYAASDDAWRCLIYPFQGDPYNERSDWIQLKGDFRSSMAATRSVAKELADKPCSQRDLAMHLETMDENEQFEEYSAWLDDGWLTEPGQLRDSDSGVTLIRQEDFTAIEAELGPWGAKPTKWTSASLVPWTIPMLMRRGFQPVERRGGYPVAANGMINYSESEGASWIRNP